MASEDEDYKGATEEWLSLVRDYAELRTGMAPSLILLRRSKAIDTFSASVLIVTGAMLTLLISQANGALGVLSATSFKMVIVMLLISGLLGFVSKAAFTVADIYQAVHIELFDDIERILDKHEAETLDDAIKAGIPETSTFVRLEHVGAAFIQTFPERWRQYVGRHWESGARGRYSAVFLVSAWKWTFYQVVAFGFQMVSFCLVFVMVVVGLAEQ